MSKKFTLQAEDLHVTEGLENKFTLEAGLARAIWPIIRHTEP